MLRPCMHLQLHTAIYLIYSNDLKSCLGIISQHYSCSYQFCLSATGHYLKLPVGFPLLIIILIVMVGYSSWSEGSIRRNQQNGCDPLPKLYSAPGAGQQSHKWVFALRWPRYFNRNLTCLVYECLTNTLVKKLCQKGLKKQSWKIWTLGIYFLVTYHSNFYLPERGLIHSSS